MEENKLLNKLYINPLETITSNWGKPKGFRLKGELQEKPKTNIALRTLPALRTPSMGNVIIQNWETKKDIPSDIGELLHYPVLMDRTKYNQSQSDFAKTFNTLKKADFSKEKIKKDGELLLKTVYKDDKLKNKTLMNYHHKVSPIKTNEEIVMASVFDDVNVDNKEKEEEEMTFGKNKKKYSK